MSRLRKIVKVEPVPRMESFEAYRAFLRSMASEAETDAIIANEYYTVTLDCGHKENWLSRPKGKEYTCFQCKAELTEARAV